MIGQRPRDICQRRREVKIRDERYDLPCGARDCDVCGARWSQDQRVRAVAASECLEGAVGLVTVTAPGRDRFSWGPAGSFDNPAEQRREWNRQVRRNWRRLHLKASRPVRELARSNGIVWRLLYRSWEYQKRGLLHVHLVVPAHTDYHRACSELYLSRLWAYARSYDFGYVLGGDKRERPGWHRCPTLAIANAQEAARYVCKYVASIGHGKDSMATVAQRAAKRGSVLYVGLDLLRESGVTMTTLKARRRVYSRFYRGGTTTRDWEVACALDALQRGRAPLSRGSEDVVRALFSRAPGCRMVVSATGEVVMPTSAPPPLSAVRCPPPDRGVLDVREIALAPVRFHDPERPELGSWRTEVTIA